MSAEDSLSRAEELLKRLEATRAKLEATEDPQEAVDVLAELAEIAKEVEVEVEQREARGRRCGAPDELKTLVEDYLEELELWPELHGQAESVRYAFVEMGGKRIRPVICLATGEAVGAEPEQVLPAAAALELVHNFSLVHDDLPALDDDDGAARQAERLGRVRRGEGAARRRRAARGGVPPRGVVRVVGRRARARGGDARDDRRPVPRHDGAGHRSRDGAPAEDRAGSSTRRSRSRSPPPRCRRPSSVPWRAFADELGMLFQVVDDILDGDGFVVDARRRRRAAARRRRGRRARATALEQRRRRHVGARGDRRRPRRPHGLSDDPERLVRRLLRAGVARRDRAAHRRRADARGGRLRRRAARARAGRARARRRVRSRTPQPRARPARLPRHRRRPQPALARARARGGGARRSSTSSSSSATRASSTSTASSTPRSTSSRASSATSTTRPTTSASSNGVARALRRGGSFLIDTINLLALARGFRELHWDESSRARSWSSAASSTSSAGAAGAAWTFVRRDGSRNDAPPLAARLRAARADRDVRGRRPRRRRLVGQLRRRRDLLRRLAD